MQGGFGGMVLTMDLAVDEEAVSFKDTLRSRGLFPRGFIDGGREMAPAKETGQLLSTDDTLTEEMIADEIIGDRLYSCETEKGFEIASLSSGLLDQGREMMPADEKIMISADDERLAEEMVGDEIIASHVMAG